MYKSYSELGVQLDQNQDQYSVITIANSMQKRQLIMSTPVVCIDIYADWCGPCKQIAPSYAVLASTYHKPGVCAIVKQKYEELDPEEKKQIHGIPTFHFFAMGKKIDEVIGGDIQQVEEKLKNITQNFSTIKPHVQDLSSTHGPQHNRNTIRNSRMTQHIGQTGGDPYQPNNGAIYHQQDGYSTQHGTNPYQQYDSSRLPQRPPPTQYM